MNPPPIPWFDLTRQHRSLRSQLLPALGAVLEAGSFILGPAVESFERAFATSLGARHCVGLNSGTSALHLALLALGIGPGDEVLTVSATWISTSWAISYVGATPVYVDIDPATYCMDPAAAAAAVTPRTRAILPVHLYGQPCAMEALAALARRHKLALVEDACQAHGGSCAGRPLGTWGDAACFSFYPGKNLGACGEAGAVVCQDDQIAARIRRLRDHAQASRHVHTEIGFNMRMEGVQGAVLAAKLPHLPGWVERRRDIAACYSEAWADCHALSLPREAREGRHARHIYALRSSRRDQLQASLAAAGIQSAIHYPTPVHLQPAYQHLNYRAGQLPHTEALAKTELSVPLFPELRADELARVCEAVRHFAMSSERAAA